MALGRAIAAYRRDRGISIEELGSRSSLGSAFVRGSERGERVVRFTHLIALASALGVHAHELVAAAEPPGPQLGAGE